MSDPLPISHPGHAELVLALHMEVGLFSEIPKHVRKDEKLSHKSEIKNPKFKIKNLLLQTLLK